LTPALLSFPTRRSSDLGPGSGGHGRGDRNEVRVLGRQLRQRIAEDSRPLRRAGVDGLQLAGDGIVRRAGVILLEIGLGQREALSDRKSTRLNSSHEWIS